jgi:hypothetical protein
VRSPGLDVVGEAGEKTMKHYMTAVLSKIGARSRVEAALIGYKAGLGRRCDSFLPDVLAQARTLEPDGPSDA